MLSRKMTEQLTYQVNRELFSSYLYLSMSAYATSIGLNGIAQWMISQMQEEMFHAQKIYNYINEQGEHVILQAIEQPDVNFDSIIDVFEKTLAHERVVTGLINQLMTLAREEKDYATESFLGWFIDEQVEEEASAMDVLTKLKLIEGDGRGLLMLDADLGKRVFTAPAAK